MCRASHINLAEVAVIWTHDRECERYGSILDFTSQTALHSVFKEIVHCKSVCDVKSRIDKWVQITASFDHFARLA